MGGDINAPAVTSTHTGFLEFGGTFFLLKEKENKSNCLFLFQSILHLLIVFFFFNLCQRLLAWEKEMLRSALLFPCFQASLSTVSLEAVSAALVYVYRR